MNLGDMKVWLGIVTTVASLVLGGIGGYYYQRGQEDERTAQFREEVRSELDRLHGKAEDIEVSVEAVRSDIRMLTTATCETLGFESVLDPCPLVD